MSYRTPPSTNGHAPRQRAATDAEMAYIRRHGTEAFHDLSEPDRAELASGQSWENGGTDAENRNGHRQESTKQAGESSLVVSVAVEEFKPFPLDVLPQPVRGFVEAASKAIGCDPCFIAVPLLVACAAAIGNTRRVRLKAGWSEPPILWAALLAYSGDSKSPAIELALKQLREVQRLKLREHAEEHRRWVEHELPQYEKSLAEWKRSKGDGEPPVKPPEPIAWRCLVDDATIEALASLLATQPRGLLLACDELAGWLGGFERYKSKGASGDSAKWLEVHGGRMLLVDRKTGQPKTLCIPRASVSVVGGIQPEILRRCMTAEHRASGLSARLLVCWPPRRVKRWTEAEVHPETEAALAGMLARLLTMKMQPVENDDPRPHLVDLDQDAKRLFVQFYNQHSDEQSAMTGELCATWSKLEAYAPRLALIHHLIRWANGEIPPDREFQLDADSMQAGIALANWFGHEVRRVHAMFDESDEHRDQRELVEWIERRGGIVTPRDLQRNLQRFRGLSEIAESALDKLVKAKRGEWRLITETGGGPRREFILAPTRQESENKLKNESLVGGEWEKTANATLGERYLTEGEIDQIGGMFG
jgi:hypothetical protein